MVGVAPERCLGPFLALNFPPGCSRVPAQAVRGRSSPGNSSNLVLDFGDLIGKRGVLGAQLGGGSGLLVALSVVLTNQNAVLDRDGPVPNAGWAGKSFGVETG